MNRAVAIAAIATTAMAAAMTKPILGFCRPLADAGRAASSPSSVPQLPQNFIPRSFSVPHFEQMMGSLSDVLSAGLSVAISAVDVSMADAAKLSSLSIAALFFGYPFLVILLYIVSPISAHLLYNKCAEIGFEAVKEAIVRSVPGISRGFCEAPVHRKRQN